MTILLLELLFEIKRDDIKSSRSLKVIEISVFLSIDQHVATSNIEGTTHYLHFLVEKGSLGTKPNYMYGKPCEYFMYYNNLQ